MKTVVKVVLGAILLFFAVMTLMVALVLVTPAHAAETQWDKWNVAPYASSQEEACKKMPAAIDGFNMPSEVKGAFKAKLGVDCKDSTEVWLVPHQLLEQMWSGPDVRRKEAYVIDKKSVGELPVLRSPDGRPYRKGAVAETAKAFSWTVVHEGKTYVLHLPFVCFNWAWAFGPSAPAFAQIGQCPNVYTLKVNVWERKAASLPGVEATHAKEELGERKFASTERVSRKHGAQFRKAYASGELKRSVVERAFRVSFIMTPEARSGPSEITKEEILGDIVVTGLRELQFTQAQLAWDAIRVVAVNGDVVSPPRHSGTGLKEIRFFNRLPDKKLGEWDNNPQPDCVMNEHWIE